MKYQKTVQISATSLGCHKVHFSFLCRIDINKLPPPSRFSCREWDFAFDTISSSPAPLPAFSLLLLFLNQKPVTCASWHVFNTRHRKQSNNWQHLEADSSPSSWWSPNTRTKAIKLWRKLKCWCSHHSCSLERGQYLAHTNFSNFIGQKSHSI